MEVVGLLHAVILVAPNNRAPSSLLRYPHLRLSVAGKHPPIPGPVFSSSYTSNPARLRLRSAVPAHSSNFTHRRRSAMFSRRLTGGSRSLRAAWYHTNATAPANLPYYKLMIEHPGRLVAGVRLTPDYKSISVPTRKLLDTMRDHFLFRKLENAPRREFTGLLLRLSARWSSRCLGAT